MATYAIGDIQGCFDTLQQLLDQIAFTPAQDTLWLAGDLINRGPKSLQTLRFLHSLDHCVVTVLGNHDLHLLAVAHGVKRLNRGDTLTDIIDADDSEVLLHWLQQQPLLHHCPKLNYTMVHAGIPPQWSLQQALRYAHEVEQVLQSSSASEFFSHMYGNEPSLWQDTLTTPARWRIITNYLTRMRLCDDNGQLELTIKDTQPAADSSFIPWFSHINRRTANDRIIFGHWAALNGQANTTNVFALDTGCVWGGTLTALRLEDQQLFHCPAID